MVVNCLQAHAKRFGDLRLPMKNQGARILLIEPGNARQCRDGRRGMPLSALRRRQIQEVLDVVRVLSGEPFVYGLYLGRLASQHGEPLAYAAQRLEDIAGRPPT
jgi:hypothetical protein